MSNDTIKQGEKAKALSMFSGLTIEKVTSGGSGKSFNTAIKELLTNGKGITAEEATAILYPGHPEKDSPARTTLRNIWRGSGVAVFLPIGGGTKKYFSIPINEQWESNLTELKKIAELAGTSVNFDNKWLKIANSEIVKKARLII